MQLPKTSGGAPDGRDAAPVWTRAFTAPLKAMAAPLQRWTGFLSDRYQSATRPGSPTASAPSLWSQFGGAFHRVAAFVAGIPGQVVGAFSGIGSVIASGWARLGSWAKGLVNGIGSAFQAVGSWCHSVVTAVVHAVEAAWHAVVFNIMVRFTQHEAALDSQNIAHEKEAEKQYDKVQEQKQYDARQLRSRVEAAQAAERYQAAARIARQ